MRRSAIVTSLLLTAGIARAQPNPWDGPPEIPHHGGDKVITYKPGRWLTFHFKHKQKLQFRLLVQPMLRYSQLLGANIPAGTPSDASEPTTDLTIRRARFGWKADLDHGVGVKFELQIKNMHFGLSNMSGSWAWDKRHEVRVGFIKAPGGLERDTYAFDEPFLERSVVSSFTYDRELGGEVTGWEGRLGWAGSITKNAPLGADGGDPEDVPELPPGADPGDLSRPAGNWNFAARVIAAPNDHVEASVHAGLRTREEIDIGDRFTEPNDAGTFVEPRAWKGVMVEGSADAAWTAPHVRVMVEGAARRDGRNVIFDASGVASDGTDHQESMAGYLIAGWTPDGHYGKAVDAAPLIDGKEITMRLEAAHVLPPLGGTKVDGTPLSAAHVDWFSMTGSFHWEMTRQLRLQWDVTYEIFRNAEIFGGLRQNYRRIFGEVWATFRL